MEHCGICLNVIYPNESSVVCPADQMPYHQACWHFNNGCGVLGCKHNPQTDEFIPVHPLMVVKGKQVPNLGAPGKKNKPKGWVLVILSCATVVFLCCCCSFSTYWLWSIYAK